MIETPAKAEPDLRAGRYLASLRQARGLSPEQMGEQCGVGGGTIRGIESKGTYPQLATQERIAAFLGLAKEQIWRDPRKPVSRKRTPPEKAMAAVQAGRADGTAQALVRNLSEGEAFELGIAWAVIRGLSPFASEEAVAEKALAAVDWHGTTDPARSGA